MDLEGRVNLGGGSTGPAGYGSSGQSGGPTAVASSSNPAAYSQDTPIAAGVPASDQPNTINEPVKDTIVTILMKEDTQGLHFFLSR